MKFLIILSYLIIVNMYKLKRYSNITEYYEGDYYDIFPKRLFEIKVEKCANRCVLPFGKCLDNHTCKCEKGYLNYNIHENSYCSYKQKYQIIAFILESLTLIGGDLYLKHYDYAMIKAGVICLIGFIFFFQFPCRLCGLRDLIQYKCLFCDCFKIGTFVISIFGIVVWQIADLIGIISYRAIDGNSMPLIYFI